MTEFAKGAALFIRSNFGRGRPIHISGPKWLTGVQDDVRFRSPGRVAVPPTKAQAIISALLLVGLGACTSAPSTVKLKNGATGHVIAGCRSIEECEARSERKCKGLDYGVHEKHEERREVSSGAGLYPVMGMTSAKKETSWRYVVECNPTTRVRTEVLTDALSRAEQELYESRASAVAVSNAIVMRRNIDAICSLRPGPLRDEEIELARKAFGDFSCP